ncbi:hypothetical protein F5Y14DRAFT_439759 [Nemania sp. NC0429]|nr:hypothetical protein F5Y14DRAFT_439759 [Nemania sp. NC0429]
MSSLEDPAELNWLQPGEKEVAIVGQYVSDKAPRLHSGFGGSSHLDIERVEFVTDPQPYQSLERALRNCLTKILPIQDIRFDPGLSDRISNIEKAYQESKHGAWLDLIPNEYGLSVIKAGIAVVFKLAENSKDKRDNVLKTFSTLQKTLLRLHPDRARFRADPKVYQSTASLHQAIVRAVEDLIAALSYLKLSRATKISARLKHQNQPEETRPTLDGILETLETDIGKYNDAIDLARDQTHERTENYSRTSAVKAILVHEDTAYLRRLADADAVNQRKQRQREATHRSELLEAMRVGERGLQQLAEQQRENRTLLMHLILESEKRKAIEAEVAELRQQMLHRPKPTAVVSLTQLCGILVQSLSARNRHETPNLERTFQQFSVDLGHALAEQVNSLLEYAQFRDWLSHSHQSLILVDANIRESALDRLSAISVFSSTLVTSLMEAYPETAVVTHFFCGLHASPGDAWYGPTGLVRSLILQLLMKLNTRDPEMKTWSLDFINDRGFLRDIEQHSLVDLCSVLHELLYEFTPDTYIYCIVDSISCFDVGRLLGDLGTVMEGLRNIVNDTKLVPVVKILITNPFESTRAIKSMPLFQEDPARLIYLSQNDLIPGSISSRVVGDRLLRAPSPRRQRTPSPFDYARAPPPAASAKRRIAGPVPLARGAFFDDDGDGDENPNWDYNSDDTR